MSTPETVLLTRRPRRRRAPGLLTALPALPPDPEPAGDVLTLAQAAQVCQVSAGTILRWTRRCWRGSRDGMDSRKPLHACLDSKRRVGARFNTMMTKSEGFVNRKRRRRPFRLLDLARAVGLNAAAGLLTQGVLLALAAGLAHVGWRGWG
jgi:hypothetical protein